MVWAAFYRANMHIFIEQYLGIKLKLFQKIIIVAIEHSMFFMFWAARGIGKTYLTAVYLYARCILYPGTKVVIASGNRDQAAQVLQKILSSEISGKAPDVFRAEVKSSIINAAKAEITFRNGSYIEVVTARDSARSHRAHVIVCDEFRMVDNSIIKDVLQPMAAVPRQPAFLDREPYCHDKEKYMESNKEIYMSSAYYKSHWSYEAGLTYLDSFLKGREYFICGLPYQLAIREGLTDKKQIQLKMQEADFSPTRWQMERECIFFGENESAFFELADLQKARRVNSAIYPQDIYSRIGQHGFMFPQKKDGEIRILTVDVALMGGKKNDATAIFMIQLIPYTTTSGQQRFRRNVVSADALDGGHTGVQALSVRRLYHDLDCDYIVLDCLNAGVGIYDRLVEEIYDSERVETYEALTCMNDDVLAARCIDEAAKPVIYAIKGSSQFNSDAAIALRDDIKQGTIRLLVGEEDAERMLNNNKWFKTLDTETRVALLLPYVHTTLLVDEMIGLSSEFYNGRVRLKEQASKRKDRYSSLSYGNMFARTLERTTIQETVKSSQITDIFKFRAPSTRAK